MGEKSKPVINVFNVIFEVTIRMVSAIMWLTPVGICSIIIGKILTAENLTVMLAQLSWFILTVVIGVFLYQLIILQVVYVVFVRKNPFSFYFSLAQV